VSAADITIQSLEVDSLVPHEDVIRSKLLQTISNMKNHKAIYPIIVDKNSLVILDGHHRYYSAKALGIRKIPAILLDYRDERIRVGKWFREVYGKVPKGFMSKFEGGGEACVDFLGHRVCSSSPYSLLWKMHWIEESLAQLGIRVTKNPEKGVEPPSLSKDYVMDIAKRGLRFPPKTTRHMYEFIIPSRLVTLDELI
jgi:hypothetical protein